jgi:hypothetical protein
MTPVRTAGQQCEVRLEWVAVDCQDQPVEEYKLEIKSRDSDGEETDEFIEYVACGSNSEDVCVIPMDTLQAEPFNLQVGDWVIAIVSA